MSVHHLLVITVYINSTTIFSSGTLYLPIFSLLVIVSIQPVKQLFNVLCGSGGSFVKSGKNNPNDVIRVIVALQWELHKKESLLEQSKRANWRCRV